nr:putative butyrophilin-like protein 10 [Oryctolagus cuniculus]
MELRWYRSRPLPTMYLHRRRAQVSREQMAESRGRTTFLGNHLARGKAVLGIHNITVYDNGTYPCLFRDGEPHSETTLALQVAGLGLEPRIHVTEDLDKGIRAECTSAGWYPEPHVEWRDFRGHAVPAVTRFSASATTGLLAVLSRVAVPDRSMGGLTCSISSPLLHERKVAESHLPAGGLCLCPKLNREESEEQPEKGRLQEEQELGPGAGRDRIEPFQGEREWGAGQDHAVTHLGLLNQLCAVLGPTTSTPGPWLAQEAPGAPSEPVQPGSAGCSLGVSSLESRDGACSVTVSPSLDPATASPRLSLSEDQKSMRRLLFDQDLPPCASSFNQDPCVLAWSSSLPGSTTGRSRGVQGANAHFTLRLQSRLGVSTVVVCGCRREHWE